MSTLEFLLVVLLLLNFVNSKTQQSVGSCGRCDSRRAAPAAVKSPLVTDKGRAAIDHIGPLYVGDTVPQGL